MATTTHLQHSQHPLEPRDFSKDSIPHVCGLCNRKILADGYACLEGCMFYAHRVCAEAPPQTDLKRLHFLSYREEIRRKIPERIDLPLHPHSLTWFSGGYDYDEATDCVICKENVAEGGGYRCENFYGLCKFFIHKKCFQDLYWTDGTKAPQFYHKHPLETFLGGDTGSSRFAKFGSKASSGEFIGCAECQVFYCRDCVQVPESIQYPHHKDHNLVLFINGPVNQTLNCETRSVFRENELCYGCPSCKFFAHVGCALEVLSYCEEGMSAEIKLSWHGHPLHLGHSTKYDRHHCSYCEDEVAGPMYACKVEGCKFILHKRCIEIKSTIIHPHHPDDSLTLCEGDNYPRCRACSEIIHDLNFSCKNCAFYLHVKCAAHVPDRKHPLHEHELLHLEKAPSWKCNRCGTDLNSPFFRCVPCNFNLHEECLDLPLVVENNEVHWHPLTLHETYIEDDSGEYYCDKCEKMRDDRMGVYVCLRCSQRWAYHIECIFPELRKVCLKEPNAAEIERVARDITKREEEVREVERKLEEMKRELDEQRKKHAKLTGR